MARFRDIRSLQKLASVHASIHGHFHQDRHLNRRSIFQAEPVDRSGRVASARGLRSRHPLWTEGYGFEKRGLGSSLNETLSEQTEYSARMPDSHFATIDFLDFSGPIRPAPRASQVFRILL